MKADPFAQLKLLDVQALDSRADQLRHQRTHLPEIEEISSLEAARAELDGRRRDLQMNVDDLTAAQRKADLDVEQVKTRRTRDRDRMDRGLITNPKDLERMGHELESLDRRITVLEDEEIEVMELLETAQAELDSLVVQVAAADERLVDLAVARDEKVVGIERELEVLIGERASSVETLPGDLLALYERLRDSKGGVGAAELRQRRCTGCQLGIDNAELAVIKSASSDLVFRCEECTRILVRTSESGL